jgi:hypothetical protein
MKKDKVVSKENISNVSQVSQEYIKIKKRNIIFRFLRRKIGVDNLAFQVYKLQNEILELKNKLNQLT